MPEYLRADKSIADGMIVLFGSGSSLAKIRPLRRWPAEQHVSKKGELLPAYFKWRDALEFLKGKFPQDAERPSG